LFAKKLDQKNDTETWSDRSSTKININLNCVKAKSYLSMESDRTTGSISKTLVDDADWKVSAGAKFFIRPKKEEFIYTGEASILTPDLSGARGWLNVSILL